MNARHAGLAKTFRAGSPEEVERYGRGTRLRPRFASTRSGRCSARAVGGAFQGAGLTVASGWRKEAGTMRFW